MSSSEDRDRFYRILQELENRIGLHQLADCHGRMDWPTRGVYFFLEEGEVRSDGLTRRVVRVGTHAVSAGSKTILWNRLSNHRGTAKGTGNHRGSVFRRHVGTALLNRGDITLSPNTWGQSNSAPPEVRHAEQDVERAVSTHICAMPFLWVQAMDESGTESIRAILERNAIRLLSRASACGTSADPASEAWLGHHAKHDAVRASALWNVRETTGNYDPGFLDLLEACASKTMPV